MKIVGSKVLVTDDYINIFLKTVGINPIGFEGATPVYQLNDKFNTAIQDGQLVFELMRDNVLKTGRRLG
ncbi:hypothetical protein M3196_00325 [Fictibacillus nanhaiensis]|uniref:hypothetical protein n=1 Tax=Fictibacillus nanhaiensis TaxID=742169 RepID=UPI00203BFCFA|nr:hypothetical protein [Fictibacillus nanhaiensis]MCM3730113.1 hypothetical protein [Fictibacillus nanhaiensis]